MRKFNIQPVNKSLAEKLRHKIDFKTKPLGALGLLEDIALKIGLIQNTLEPDLKNPHIVVFAGDHGITQEGVSAYPQEVTFQMVTNFLNGGAAINVFCKQHDIAIKVVDAGVNHDFSDHAGLINAKIGYGTKNFLLEPAMSIKQAQKAIDKGSNIVSEIYYKGCNMIGFGEMGIGNTSSASLLMHLITGCPIEECVGKGTGLTAEDLQHKIEVLSKAVNKHSFPDTPLKILATFGGFEIVEMTGAMLRAAELGMTLLIDGFIATAAFGTAVQITPDISDYAIFCHKSHERGHQKLLEYLKAKPVLDLNMRLGEGTGCAIAYPVIQSAVNFLNEMASFESAGVSNKAEKAKA